MNVIDQVNFVFSCKEVFREFSGSYPHGHFLQNDRQAKKISHYQNSENSVDGIERVTITTLLSVAVKHEPLGFRRSELPLKIYFADVFENRTDEMTYGKKWQKKTEVIR